MPSYSSTAKKESIFFFVVIVASAVAVWKRRRIQEERALEVENQQALDALSRGFPSVADSLYLQLAHKYRLGLVPPQQSNFRVVAILLLEGGDQIFGTNDEPSPNISLAMCAERCALLKYRVLKRVERVKTIYIVTDADTPVSPGTACREYMSGHPAVGRDTRIVMQSKNMHSEPLVLSLAELYPFPSIYTGLNPRDQVKLGETIQQSVRIELEQLHVPRMPEPLLIRLVQAARQACEMDTRDSLHAIRYGAAMAIETDKSNGTVEILQASQIKALEYSSTLDAVCQLASQALSLTRKGAGQRDAPRVLAVVQVDQFGIPHGPFAQARAFLVEHGFGDCQIILTTTKARDAGNTAKTLVQTVAARDLAPFVPEFRSGD